jgi:PBSX family phage terminase large subunit
MSELSDKQIQSIRECNAKINIWEGAVRSGKTYASLWAFLKMLTHGPAGEYALLSKTYDSFKRNILPQLYQMIGADPKHYSGKRELEVWGKKVHIIGCDDERAESKIRGATFAGAYVDEMTIIPESCFRMLISRCAIGDSRILGTTNPDSPYHYLKTDFLENNTDVKSWQFTLEDNPQLTVEEISYLKRQYKGLWYQRYIQGLWVQAHGSIYDFFDEKEHTLNWAPVNGSYYILGLDYGTVNPCAGVLVGFNPNNFPNMWVEKEYYWSSKKRGRQKTDSEYAEDFKKFTQGYNIRAIYVDPSAASLKTEMRRAGLTNILDANNDVLPGIRKTADLLTNGTLKIVKCCDNLIQEIQSYVWDTSSANKGIEKPIKQNDHCFVKGTLVQTENGAVSIEAIMPEDKVWTRQGLKRVLRTGHREGDVWEFFLHFTSVTCTNDHKFFTYNGWKEVKDLIPSDILYHWSNEWENGEREKQSGLKEKSTDDIQMLHQELEDATLLEMESISIEKCGNPLMEKSPHNIISITKTGTPLTIIYPIWNASTNPSIFPNIRRLIQSEIFQLKLEKLLKSGTDLLKEEIGTKNMQPNQDLLTDQPACCCAPNAQKSMPLPNHPTLDFVQISVKLSGGETLKLTMRTDAASCATHNFPAISSLKPFAAPKHVGPSTVYNLEVEDCPEFFANGWLVHNCLDALRYALYSHNYENKSNINWDELRREVFY